MLQIKIFIQPLSQRHQECTTQCSDFVEFQPQQIRLQTKTQQEYEILDISKCEKELKRLQMIKWQSKNQKRKWRKHYTVLHYKSLSFKLLENLRQSVKQLVSKEIPAKFIASHFGISKQQVYYLGRNNDYQLEQGSFFNINKRHIRWLCLELQQLPVDNLYSSQYLFERFSQKFELNEQALSISSFRKILKQHCKASFKLPQKKDRRSIGQAHKDLSAQKFNFVFLDESSMGHMTKAQKCWQIRIKPKTLITTPRQSNISLLGALGTKHFIGYQLVLGNINSTIFKNHLTLLIKALQNHYQNETFILILDNCQVHKSNQIINLLDKIQYRFLPTYTPQLNAIEKVWQSLKMFINKQGIIIQTGIFSKIHQFFNQLSNEELDQYIYSIIPFLKMSLKREDY